MKTIKRILLLCLIVLVVIAGVQIKGGYDKYKDALEERPLVDLITELQGKENYTQYEDVPEIYFKALVAVEDRRFYKHNGFDIMGSARAIYNDIKAWELLEGGSTISQQLAKNLYFPKDHTLQRKIAEIFMALKIEREYEKEDVLEFYVNGIYYGSGYYSIYDASMGYFDKEPKDMNDYECTLLVGIPNAPSIYSLDVRPDLAKQRQEKVIGCMVDVEYITEDEGNSILKEKNND
ncbi:MAG: transglycosylase domain-containing protein [Clostridia bacterium]|nr:transglycosylase domain-containing protein [Clostridia bacterium]